MKNLFIIAIVVVGLSACTSTERGATTGGLIGAGAGLLATGNSTGILVGAAAGSVVGALIGKSRDGRCIYRRRDGSRYKARC